MIENLFKELCECEQIEALALGGSRAGENFDENSDYDVYVYCTSPVPENVRRKILSRYCSVMELGNHFWEYEDNCRLNNGVDIDILYRNLNDFSSEVADVAEKFNAHNGYTTCMWHNLINCRIIYDRGGKLAAAKKRFSIGYPQQLRKNIIEHNMALLHNAMPAYDGQILKAAKRGDIVAVNHRIAAFLESYFDILFALNSVTHPGEKRLIELCKKSCKILPDKFEENIERLLNDMYGEPCCVADDLHIIVTELEKVL